MAKIELNRALTKLRGTIDGFTYRMTPDGQATVYAADPSDRPPSAAQVDRRERFQWAQYYARQVLADPLQQRVYRKLAKARKRPTNALLIANYLNPPEIELVETGKYTGQAGQEIRVIANDDIAVAAVRVVIAGQDGVELERGDATMNHDVWTYRTTQPLAAGVGCQIEVTVTNRAGHAVVATVACSRNPDGTLAAAAPTFRTVPPEMI